MDLRDEVMGTEGTIWVNSFLRTGFEMFTTGKGSDYVAEKAESDSGWLFPVGDELNELGYNHMFADMFAGQGKFKSNDVVIFNKLTAEIKTKPNTIDNLATLFDTAVETKE